ncbi:MAG: 5-formyltetrahydrofolate cyclo-ligase [Nocardioidaceae bacterium]
MSDPAARKKAEVRAVVLARRATRGEADQSAAATALADRVLELPELRTAACVAGYVSTVGEPGTGPLLIALRRRGVRVLLPLLRRDFDLDWAELTDPADLQPGRFGILEPAGPPLGVDAVLDADVAICPGIAADLTGHRLGRGGGSYDRVLARVGSASLRCLLLYDDEVLDDVPRHDHDQEVDLVVTPSRVVRAAANRP